MKKARSGEYTVKNKGKGAFFGRTRKSPQEQEMVSLEGLEDKELIKRSKLRYTDNNIRSDKIKLLFEILKNKKMEVKHDTT